MKRSIIYIGVAAVVGLSGACTKLDEKSYDKIDSEKFFTNKNEVVSAVLRPYTHESAWVTSAGSDGWWRLSELSADQLAWPTKGRHGEDGGKWKRLHYHSWTTDEGGLNSAWTLIYEGMGQCNYAIENIEKRDLSTLGITQEEKDSFLAELKLNRAFHYLKLLDLWGNVPVSTQVGVPVDPANMTRKEVFDFIEKEIKDNIGQAPVLSRAMMGRMTQASGYAMLTELYLNAEVWSGTPRWDDCIAAADKLITNQAGGQNGSMALDPNITDQFKTNNDLSNEVIFSIAYDYTRGAFEPRFPADFYHFKEGEIYGGNRTGNNGVVVIPGVWTKYDAADKRKAEWFHAGIMTKFIDGVTPVTGSEEYSGKPLEFVDNIQKNSQGSTVSNMSEGEENSGIRFNKYKIGNNVKGPGSLAIDPSYNDTDWNVYRLTWIYFAKAEALMRKAGGVADAVAVQLINDSKKRAFTAAEWPDHAYTTGTLTLDELLAERGREFIFEGFRRDDLIRFGKFVTGTWWDHTASSVATKTLYPIPQQQRDLNVNLKQNPGY